MLSADPQRIARLEGYAAWRYRMGRLASLQPAYHENVSRIAEAIEAGKDKDPATGRPLFLKPEDMPVELEDHDWIRVLVAEWLSHPEKPPIIGRWAFWFGWLLSPYLRAYWSGRERGIASVPASWIDTSP